MGFVVDLALAAILGASLWFGGATLDSSDTYSVQSTAAGAADSDLGGGGPLGGQR